jgi:peptidoglycan/LPS O-acetylase OafA/YrhL
MTRRNSTLDLLRAVAIGVVVVCHVGGNFGPESSKAILGLGGKGVDLFFALSGWLLGQQLVREYRNRGTIDVRRFWIRRWLRTLPAYYAVLLLTFAQQLMKSNPRIEWSYLFFGQAYLTDMPYFSITWSLCIEEHFYLVIAPLLLLLLRGPILGFVVLTILAAIPSVVREMHWYTYFDTTHVRFDQCLVGVMLAYTAESWPKIWERITRLARLWATLASLGIVWNILARTSMQNELVESGPLGWSLISAAFIVLANSGPFWATGTQSLVTRYLADRAYSLYLLHIEAIAITKKLGVTNFWLAMVATWIIACVLAEVLYRCVERPIMNSRDRIPWARSRTT